MTDGATGIRSSLQHRRVRCYLNLRTAHLERAHEFAPASIVYARRKYDFDPAKAEGLDIVQAGMIDLARLIWRTRPTVLEVNEPFMWHGMHRTVVAIATARLSAASRREPVRIVSYAIENRDAFETVPTRLRSRLRRLLHVGASRVIARSLDRLAFGTPGTQHLYGRRYGRDLHRTDVRLFAAVPAPCACPPAPDHPTEDFLFVGAFDERKGIRELLAAWPLVSAERPTASLRLMGKGPLLDEVRDGAARLDRVELEVDPPRDRIHTSLRLARILVLLSQPSPTWREQVGLPLVEGLSHGCSVVTTEQTGLADWLDDHGHAVIDSASSPETTAVALIRALDARRDPSSVLADLPEVDGRAAADHWLMTGP